MAAFLVWSNDHRMWWRPGHRGYTEFIDEAGRYARAEAEKIVAGATINGQLTVRRTDPVTGREYSQLSEVLVAAPEDIPLATAIRLVIVRTDDEHLTVEVDGAEVAHANHDEHGWSGMDAVEKTARGIAEAAGLAINEEWRESES
jgi:hypothetical protein